MRVLLGCVALLALAGVLLSGHPAGATQVYSGRVVYATYYKTTGEFQVKTLNGWVFWTYTATPYTLPIALGEWVNVYGYRQRNGSVQAYSVTIVSGTPKPSPTPTRSPSPSPTSTHTPSPSPTHSATPSPMPMPTSTPIAVVVLTPAPAATDPPPIGNTSSGSTVGNGSPAGATAAPVGTPTPTPTPPPPTPTPAPSIAALPDSYVYWGLSGSDQANRHVSPNNVAAYLDYCQGSNQSIAGTATGADTGGAWPTDCPHAYYYVSLNMMQPGSTGSTNILPWNAPLTNGSSAHGGTAGETCPSDFTSANFALKQYNATTAPYSPNWTSTDNTKNWGVYSGTIGDPASQIMGAYGSTGPYTIFTNWGSTLMLASTNAAIDNCAYGGVALDKYEGMWEDNTFPGLQAAAFTVWGGVSGYPTGTDWGSGITIPLPNPCGTTPCYADPTFNGGLSTGTGYFNGAYHTRTTKINANPLSGGNTTYPADSGGTSSVITAIQSFVGGLKHKDGVTPYKFQYNVEYNAYGACQVSNRIPNVTMGTEERATSRGWGDGTPQPDEEQWMVIDVASDAYACGGSSFGLLDDMSSTSYGHIVSSQIAGASALGTPAQQMQIRIHYAMLWLMANDKYPHLMISWKQMCQGASTGCVSTQTWTDVLGGDFLQPSGRITPFPAQALGASNNYCGVSTFSFWNFNGTNCPNTQGGSHDSNIAASASSGGACSAPPECVFKAAFNHATVQNQDKPSPTLSAVAGTSPGTAVYVVATCVSAATSGFQGFYSAQQTLTPSTAQQVQVLVPTGTPNCSFYDVYAGSTSGGPYHLQNATPQAAGTSYLISGTLNTVSATPPCGANWDRRNWNTTCTHDIGPMVVLRNLSTATATLSATFLQNAIGTTVYNQLAYVINPGCKPLAGMIGTTAGSPLWPADGPSGTPNTTVQCAAGTYYDVYNGTQIGSWAIAPTLGTTFPDGEAVIYTKGQP